MSAATQIKQAEQISVDELVARARKLAGRIALRAEEAEQNRRIHDETIAEIADAGLFQILVPKRFGGYELSPSVMVDILRVLSPLCVSTGWNSGFYMVHNWMWSLLPEEAQEEIFADKPYALGPVMVAPSTRATPVDGGFRINGRAKWGTGSAHADWCMVSAIVDSAPAGTPNPGGPAPPSVRMFAMPWSEARTEATWFTSGMAATSSNDVIFEDVFVPHHRVMDAGPARSGESRSAALHGNHLYSTAFSPMLALAAVAPLVGGTLGIVEHAVDRAKTFVSSFSGKVSVDNPALQIRLARANLSAHAASVLLDDLTRSIEMDSLAPPIDISSRALQRAKASYIATLCRDTVTLLAQGSGASGHMLSSPVQRAFRDISMASCHVVFDQDPTMELHGKMLVGRPPEVILA
jgi:3-hydroxy-9,10-secoandrosta-1,3,5(10)-triene-9,17-dione monooxygenase